jgi:hypothetical protein
MSDQRVKTAAAFGEATAKDSGSAPIRYDVGRISHLLFVDLERDRLP